MSLRGVILPLVLFTAAPLAASEQRTLKVTDAWVTVSASGDTMAFAVVENGTMYEVYLTGAESEVAEAVELLQAANGKSALVKEVAVGAFDRLAMTAESVHLRLKGVKKPVTAGDTVPLTLSFDNGDRLSVEATVK